MLNARSIQGILVLAISLVLSIWLGVAVVTDTFETLLKVGGTMLLMAAALLGRRIWLLLILFTSMNVVLYSWFGTTDIGQMIFIAFSLILFLMRKLNFELQFTELEFWMLLIVGCILQAYMRFPVGLNILGAGNIGGRPYFVLALSITSYYILSTLRVPENEIRWAMRLTLIGGFLGIPLKMARFGSFTASSEADASRVPILSEFSILITRWVSPRISIVKALTRPAFGLIIIATILIAAGSGYRNAVAMVGFIYLAATYYHGGLRSFLGCLIISVFALALLALFNLAFPLPGIIQRALSPLPGTWEEQYVKDADQSTKWRVEMWKEALFTDRWIHNKIVGDGIGMSTSQLAQNENIAGGMSSSGLLVQQENMLINGSYHSGPVHSVRMTGYVGLTILLLAMIRLAVHSHRQLLRCRGTEWFIVAMFFGIPNIVSPFFFAFMFGEYLRGVAQTFLGMAMIRLLQRNLPIPAWKPVSREPYILNIRRQREAQAQARQA